MARMLVRALLLLLVAVSAFSAANEGAQTQTTAQTNTVAAPLLSEKGSTQAVDAAAVYQAAVQQLEALDPARSAETASAPPKDKQWIDEQHDEFDEWQELFTDALNMILRQIFPKTTLLSNLASLVWGSNEHDASKPVAERAIDLYAYGSVDPTAEPMLIEPNDSPQIKRTKAIYQLRKAAYDLGSSDALKKLADIHLYGLYGHPRNATTAFSHYNALADKGNATAQRIVGTMYAIGIGVPRSYPKALVYMSFAALGGDVLADQTLGYWHFTGVGMPKSCENAAWHYMRTATASFEKFRDGPPGGRPIPSLRLNLINNEGGVYGEGASGGGNPLSRKKKGTLSQDELLTYYRLQAETGDGVAQYMVGNVYYHGTETVPRDFSKAMHFFLMAVKQHPGMRAVTASDASKTTQQLAQYAGEAAGYLGVMHWRGEGVKADPIKARKWFEQGVMWDNGASYNGLGMMYMTGEAGLERDQTRAVKYLSEAVNRNHADAMVNLAEYLMRTPKFDRTQVTNLLTVPAQKGNIPAYYHMGRLLLQEPSISTNCKMAVLYLKSVAETGDWLDASLAHAETAYKRNDFELALLNYLFVAERGRLVAQLNAAWMLDQGIFDPRTSRMLFLGDGNTTDPYEGALYLWNRAANQGNEDARVRVGDYYYMGIGLASIDNAHENDKGAATNASLAHARSKSWYEMFSSAAFLIPNVRLSQPMYDRAVAHYQVAAETDHSSMAMFNLGHMYEYGLGIAQDYHLAKRWYDMSLTTNPAAYLAVNLALVKLMIKWTFSRMLQLIGLGPKPSSSGHDALDGPATHAASTPLAHVETNTQQQDTQSQSEYKNTVIALLLGAAGFLYFWRQRIQHQRAAIENARAYMREQVRVALAAVDQDLPATVDDNEDGLRQRNQQHNEPETE